MRLILVVLALASAAAALAQEEVLDGSCEFASTSRGVLAVSEDVSRVSSFATPVKFLFENKKCTDFMLCVEDGSLSGGSGCTVAGARSESTNVCSIKGTNRGDDTYMLALQDAQCKGLDLVNCLSVSVQGNRLQISQSCAAKLGALTFTCLGCQPATPPASSAIVAVAQDGPYNAQRKKCDKYGWCGKCDCPPVPPPDNQKTCVAACAGKSTCQPIDNTLCRKFDTKTCEARDTTRCELDCKPPPGPTPVICPAVRAKAVLVVEKLDTDTGEWVVQNVNGENPYTVDQETKNCPQCPQCAGTPDALCRAVKTGSCTPVSSGSCTCQKDGFCDVQAGPARTEVITCPSKGGTSFYPCDGGCKPHYISLPCDKDKSAYPPGTKPYPPDFGYPNNPKDGYPKDGSGYPHSK